VQAKPGRSDSGQPGARRRERRLQVQPAPPLQRPAEGHFVRRPGKCAELGPRL